MHLYQLNPPEGLSYHPSLYHASASSHAQDFTLACDGTKFFCAFGLHTFFWPAISETTISFTTQKSSGPEFRSSLVYTMIPKIAPDVTSTRTKAHQLSRATHT